MDIDRHLAEFDLWAGKANLSPSSCKVYRSMWGKIIRSLLAAGIDPQHAKEMDYIGAIESMSTNGRQPSVAVCRRYAQLISRVTENFHQLPARYPEQPRKKPAEIAGEEALKLLLSMPSNTWKHLRDRAIAATMAFAGLKPGEAIAAEATSLKKRADGDFVFMVTGSRHRSAPLSSAGEPFLQAWMDCRTEMGISTRELFPASLQGGQLAFSTVYRKIESTMKEAGIQKRLAGGSLLRHGFGYRQAFAGVKPVMIKNWMGLFREKSVEVYLPRKGKPV